jgi:hypothetical protein
MSKQLINKENKKDIGKTTVDSWDTNLGGRKIEFIFSARMRVL